MDRNQNERPNADSPGSTRQTDGGGKGPGDRLSLDRHDRGINHWKQSLGPALGDSKVNKYVGSALKESRKKDEIKPLELFHLSSSDQHC